MIVNYNDPSLMRKTINNWILALFIVAIFSLIAVFIAKRAFSAVGENITLNIRKDLYTQILKKHIGWHDN
jgi:ABC-type multidrug transport system fused ATPase/permease subunit